MTVKREYKKPMVVFETFSMSTNIAAGCEVKTKTPSQHQCGVYLEGAGFVFIMGMTGCEDIPISANVAEFNKICYHVPYESNNLFNS